MKKFLYNWFFWKHFILCVVIWLLIVTVNSGTNEASSIGIIGGADGPTEIFISGGMYPYILRVLVLIIALALYVPVKNIFKKVFEPN